MIGYLLICYVDTERVSHNQEIVHEIINYINYSDILAVEFTFLFKVNEMDIPIEIFNNMVTDFFYDPAGIKEYYDNEDEYEDEDEEFEEEESNTIYEKDYTPLLLHFVSSRKMFDEFCKSSEDIDIPDCDEFYCLPFNISCLDQMEILKKIQQTETDTDLLDKAIKFNGEKSKQSFRKIYDRYKN